MRYTLLALLVVSLCSSTLSAACGDDGGGTNQNDAPFGLAVRPEFVQGLLADQPVNVLVTIEGSPESDEAVTLEATFTGGTVAVQPEQIRPGQIAEVSMTADAVTDDVAGELTIIAKRGSVSQTASRQVIVVPGEDDREVTARGLLALFAAWLEREHPDLGIKPDTTFDGVMVGPRLLVVSHYQFTNDAYELGLSWHIMIPPDDWSELYLRPRNELSPTRAFRMSSWNTAIEGGQVDFTEVSPPAEVVR
jgi:hypothetical protein